MLWRSIWVWLFMRYIGFTAKIAIQPGPSFQEFKSKIDAFSLEMSCYGHRPSVAKEYFNVSWWNILSLAQLHSNLQSICQSPSSSHKSHFILSVSRRANRIHREILQFNVPLPICWPRKVPQLIFLWFQISSIEILATCFIARRVQKY